MSTGRDAKYQENNTKKKLLKTRIPLMKESKNG
jgi:hypothetical protein